MSTYKPFYEPPEYVVAEISVGSPEAAQIAKDTANQLTISAPPSGGASALLYNPQTSEFAFGSKVLGRLDARDLQNYAYEAAKAGSYKGPRPEGFIPIDHNRLLADLSVTLAKTESNETQESSTKIFPTDQETSAKQAISTGMGFLIIGLILVFFGKKYLNAFGLHLIIGFIQICLFVSGIFAIFAISIWLGIGIIAFALVFGFAGTTLTTYLIYKSTNPNNKYQ